jgi:glycine cleavage system transcriptional repressor
MERVWPMQSNIVLTLTGTDRIGIVEEVTGLLLGLGGNVETSRMARLGGEFAIILLVSFPGDGFQGLETVEKNLAGLGFKVTTCATEGTYAEAHVGWLSHKIEVHGADHEGIIHEIAAALSRQGISIESMETETSRAPVTGMVLFSMTAHVVSPPGLRGKDWEKALIAAGRNLNVDVRIQNLR